MNRIVFLLFTLLGAPGLAATLPPARPDAPIQVRFAGVSTLLFDDHHTAWMIDGFFTRPSLARTALGKIEPSLPLIRRNLQRLGSPRLAAVIPLHSHYDHAMDAPLVAMETGAVLVGSESTLNLGRGFDMPEGRLKKVEPGETIRLGKWTLTFFASRHVPSPFGLGFRGTIDHQLEPPQRVGKWREGQTWLILVEHESGPSMLVTGSSNVPEQPVTGRRADVVFLATAMLGKQPEAYRAQVWNELVLCFGARRVIPTHWDNFWKPLDEPLSAMPAFADNFGVTMADFGRRAQAAGIDLALPPLFTPFEPAPAQVHAKAARPPAGCRKAPAPPPLR